MTDAEDHQQSKNNATWRLLVDYNDRFAADVDYEAYTTIIQQATGAEDVVIQRAITFRKSPYSKKSKPTKRPTNTKIQIYQLRFLSLLKNMNMLIMERRQAMRQMPADHLGGQVADQGGICSMPTKSIQT